MPHKRNKTASSTSAAHTTNPSSNAATDQPNPDFSTVLPERTRENDAKALTQARKAVTAKEKTLERDKNYPRKSRLSSVIGKLKKASTPALKKAPEDAIPEYHDNFNGAYTPTTLALRNIYQEGKFRLPKCFDANAKKETWSGIGYPLDKSLIIPDIEARTYIDNARVNIAVLAKDIWDVAYTPFANIEGIDLASIESVKIDGRKIDRAILHGRKVVKVKVDNTDVTEKGYGKTTSGINLEAAINKGLGPQPSVEVEAYITTHILLRQGSKGGRMDTYWKDARGLAQQHLALTPELNAHVRGRLDDENDPRDPSFDEMLQIVMSINGRPAPNIYYQAQRDAWAVENNKFYHITGADIVIVVDAKHRPIVFQLTEAFKRLLNESVEKDVIEAFEIYSKLHPIPLADLSRHGVHWSKWLREHPELDFRTLLGDAISGVYHLGWETIIGRAVDLVDGPSVKIDSNSSGKRIKNWPHVIKQQERFRYGALGACTEILKYLFQIIEPVLCASYEEVTQTVADSASKSGIKDYLTRRAGDIFAMRAVLINAFTTDHLDKSDWMNGFAGLVAVGNWRGGDLLIREFGLRISTPPGSAQLMRGTELHHSTTEYDGRRYVSVNVIPEAIRSWAVKITEAANGTASATQDNDCGENGGNLAQGDEQSRPTNSKKRKQRHSNNSV